MSKIQTIAAYFGTAAISLALGIFTGEILLAILIAFFVVWDYKNRRRERRWGEQSEKERDRYTLHMDRLETLAEERNQLLSELAESQSTE